MTTTDTETNVTPTDESPDDLAASDLVPDVESGEGEPPATDEGESESDDRRVANREAAARRVQLREVETERDALRERVASLTRAAVEHVIERTEGLPTPHRMVDVWDVAGVTLEDVTDDAGNVDANKLSDVLATIHTERPYLFVDRLAGGGLLHQVLSNATPVPQGYNPNKSGGAAWQDAHKKALQP